jgi:tetratricopeptide (TPR) repeat protein
MSKSSNQRSLRGPLLVCVFCTILAAQQSQQYGLTGELQVSRGSFPPHRIEVILETRGTRAGATYTDNEGKFSFSIPLPNVYYVVVNDPDFEPVRQSYEIRELSGFNNFIQITLNPKQHDSARPAAGTNPFLVNAQEYSKHFGKDAMKEFEKGNKARQQGETDDAIRHFDKAVAIAPTFYEARNSLGLMYLAKMDFPNAEKQFSEVLKINPSDDQAYFNLGNAYLLSGHFPEAEQAVKGGLERRPDSAFGELLLGMIYSRTGDKQRAEQLLRQSLETDSTMSKARLELVNLYLKENRRQDAITELKAFLKSSPTDPFAPKAQQVLTRLESKTQ